ncbi:MAG: phosphoenolpyruvate--protein phosphotransferase [Pseudomonadota bacterium]
MTPASPIRGATSRVLLQKLRDAMASGAGGQERLDRIVRLIAGTMETAVCSVYLKRDGRTLELCATEGLNPEAVHQTRMRMGQGLVGRVAESGTPINTADAPNTRGFRYFAETGEEVFSSFLGVPVQRLGEALGVLVVQDREARAYSEDDVHGLEVIAMVIAEMAELGAFLGDGPMAQVRPHSRPIFIQAVVGQEGAAAGTVVLHEPQIVVTNPVTDDPEAERRRLHAALHTLRREVDEMVDHDAVDDASEARDVLETYRLFARDKGWITRIEAGIDNGLAAEVAVEKEQSATRTKMARATDAYLRERLSDLDDLSNRLLRILSGRKTGASALPADAVLVARNLGPAELLDYGTRLKAVVLEEGAVSSHAVIVARALAIPLVVQAQKVTREALDGDPILVDGDSGIVHLRPEDTVRSAFLEKLAMRAEAQEQYSALRDLPACGTCGTTVALHMNAGLMADLPSLESSGAEGVGLYRTELQFLIRASVPKRAQQAALYSRIMNAARGRPVIFRTLDIGSDKVLPYLKPQEEPNPALGWRAIRVGLDRRGVMRMQIQSLLRGAEGRPLLVMFPMVAQFEEFKAARQIVLDEFAREEAMGHTVPSDLKIGAMLETPSLAFAPGQFFELTDFLSIGGNDLKQFFFAADRENERVRRRYDTLNVSFLTFIRQIVERCATAGTPVSFCGEDAGRPLEAACLTAMGLRTLSMRPASIGPVKHLIRQIDVRAFRAVIDEACLSGVQSVRPAAEAWLRERGAITRV